ncbi:MAG: hypothetical protein ABSG14_15105 [Verrucomicrobiia bacterium]|jgi:hypothetical protein
MHSSAQAAMIPYYKMDSLAYLSSDVVLAQELGSTPKRTTKRGESNYDYNEVCYRVLQVFKGSSSVSNEIAVMLEPEYRRQLWDDLFKLPPVIMETVTNMTAAGTNEVTMRYVMPPGEREPKETPILLSVCLLFLRQNQEEWRLEPVLTGVKMIINGEVYGYEQTSNPGPLWLIRQEPENFAMGKTERYGEAELMKDLRIALEKSRSMTNAVPVMPWERMKPLPSAPGKAP